MRLTLPAAGSSLSVIMKLPGDTCNINCYYCYEKRKPYPDATTLSPETLRDFLATCGERPLRLELHGGEPLMLRRPQMAALFAELRSYPGEISLAMQSNGLLLTDAWVDFFMEQWQSIEIGISLDGPADVNDAYRRDYRDRGTASKVERAIQKLKAHEISIGVIAVVARPSLGRSRELLEYFSQFSNIKFLKFVPCLDYNVVTTALASANRANLLSLNPVGQDKPGWATSPAEYADFVCEAFDVWKEQYYQSFILEPVFSAMKSLMGVQPAFCHFSDIKCAHVLTLYPDGRLGSCDELRMPDALHTHISQIDSIEEVLAMKKNPTLHRRLDVLYEKCNACSYQPTCKGGCLATRLAFQGTPMDDEYCRQRITILDHVGASLTGFAGKTTP